VCFCWIFFKASTFEDAGIMINQILFNFNAEGVVPMFIGYQSVFITMFIGYLFHYLPSSYDDFAQNVLLKAKPIGRILILFFFIWLVAQVKQADQVPPIYLQF
jgi:hypothetical protein